MSNAYLKFYMYLSTEFSNDFTTDFYLGYVTDMDIIRSLRCRHSSQSSASYEAVFTSTSDQIEIYYIGPMDLTKLQRNKRLMSLNFLLCSWV